MQDYLVANNGSLTAHGEVAGKMLATMGDSLNPEMRRPYIGKDGRSRIDRYVDMGGPVVNGHPTARYESVPVNNVNASLLRLEWTLLDQVVVRAALPRLRAVADVRGRGLQFTIANGMSKTVLQTQAQSDVSPATISMDGLARSASDRPVYNLTNLPLPIIHKDFSFSQRQIAVSRNGGMPLDLSMAELAARRVAEAAEQLLLGVGPSYAYGGGAVYGFTNFPSRITYALTMPNGTNASTTLAQVLAMRLASQQALHYGPWVLYTSLAWDQYLDNDYILTGGNVATQTLRDRLRAIQGIEDVVTLDYLNGYDMVLVQQTTDVVREVVGMDITTVQWETNGGMELNFKVMCILVPQLRADFNGNTGIVHGTVSGQTTKPTGGTVPDRWKPVSYPVLVAIVEKGLRRVAPFFLELLERFV